MAAIAEGEAAIPSIRRCAGRLFSSVLLGSSLAAPSLPQKAHFSRMSPGVPLSMQLALIRMYDPPAPIQTSSFAVSTSRPSVLVIVTSLSAASAISSPCAWISTLPFAANNFMPSFCAKSDTASPAATVKFFRTLTSMLPPAVKNRLFRAAS
ncbi:hypothetical protein R70006_04301 [Paraburkholderia domus]|nr:hypothetical protein R70006_04301 [Paraburkholderia domus]